jgi:hypothetical protein
LAFLREFPPFALSVAPSDLLFSALSEPRRTPQYSVILVDLLLCFSVTVQVLTDTLVIKFKSKYIHTIALSESAKHSERCGSNERRELDY